MGVIATYKHLLGQLLVVLDYSIPPDEKYFCIHLIKIVQCDCCLQHLQTDFDRLQDDLDTEKEKVVTLQGQVESEQTTSSQIQSRLTEVIEEKETISHTNSQLQAKVKVSQPKQNFCPN